MLTNNTTVASFNGNIQNKHPHYPIHLKINYYNIQHFPIIHIYNHKMQITNFICHPKQKEKKKKKIQNTILKGHTADINLETEKESKFKNPTIKKTVFYYENRTQYLN
jgi:hypothetical protein